MARATQFCPVLFSLCCTPFITDVSLADPASPLPQPPASVGIKSPQSRREARPRTRALMALLLPRSTPGPVGTSSSATMECSKWRAASTDNSLGHKTEATLVDAPCLQESAEEAARQIALISVNRDGRNSAAWIIPPCLERSKGVA